MLQNNAGELPDLDFKEKWPEFPKVARHLLGLGNSGGGCIIVGVSQKDDKTLEPVGIEKLEDKSTIIDGIKNYIPETLTLPNKIDIMDFSYEAAEYPKINGMKFQIIFIDPDLKDLPLVARSEYKGAIRNNAIYVRRGTSTEEAGYEELQEIINKRINTGYSSQKEINLMEHLEQLKILFGQIDKYHFGLQGSYLEALRNMSVSLSGFTTSTPNPMYPDEDFENFIVNLIEKKKKRVIMELDVAEIS
ncbi:Putative DNA-binding domain protein [uncultured archaeon]|nr:Putative DNA-binding domain protein [uncultured archaeon]